MLSASIEALQSICDKCETTRDAFHEGYMQMLAKCMQACLNDRSAQQSPDESTGALQAVIVLRLLYWVTSSRHLAQLMKTWRQIAMRRCVASSIDEPAYMSVHAILLGHLCAFITNVTDIDQSRQQIQKLMCMLVCDLCRAVSFLAGT